MFASPRTTFAVLATAAALFAVGCGDDSKDKTTASTTTATTAAATTLDAATYQDLTTGASTLGTSLNAIGASAKACSGEATNGLKAVRTCVADKLDSATEEISTLADTVEADAAKVEGACKTQLTAFATELRGVVTTFKDGAKEILGGDLQAGAKVIQNIDVSGLSSAGNAAQSSCRPAAS